MASPHNAGLGILGGFIQWKSGDSCLIPKEGEEVEKGGEDEEVK